MLWATKMEEDKHSFSSLPVEADRVFLLAASGAAFRLMGFLRWLAIPLKVGGDSDLNPVTDSEVNLAVFGAQRRWRSYRA